MTKKKYYVGIDVAAKTVAATIYQSPDQKMLTKEDIANTTDGFDELRSWLKQHHVAPANSIICMETTGVYCEAIAHYLTAKGYCVCIEPALKVKRAFDPHGHKTDAVDSQQIAEYAYRFCDELRYWKPRDAVLEKIRQLLVAREQFVKQKVTTKNELHAYSKHFVQVSLIRETLQQSLNQTEQHIADIEKELQKNIHKDPDISNSTHILSSLTGVGTLLAANIITMTNNFESMPCYKTLAAYVGIAPFQRQSGSSLAMRDRSRQAGPSRMRKLLRLAAQSVATHDRGFRKYYLRKLEQGKSKALVLNNIANKLLKVAYAMLKNRKNYIKDYQSIHPMYTQLA